MPATPDVQVVLRSDGVALLVDVTSAQLPHVVHWGADLGQLSVDEFSTLVRANVPPPANNLLDAPSRVAILPEHWTGWVGRPGLSGSRSGRDWSPKFAVTEVRVDSQPIAYDGPGPVQVDRGQASVAVDAEDTVAGLALTVTIELLAGGLIRTRARLTNTADEHYQVADLVLALPVPERAREILDFAGRWAKERVPQRSVLQVGTHLREGRKGRTGADAATVLHLGTPGFGFADGEVWGVHLGWSGNHTHYAERLFSGDQVLGGGELLLPGEGRLASGASYTTPWLYGSYGRGLDAVARRFHRYLRSRPEHPSTTRPVTINVWEAVYFDHRLDRLVDLAERAAALGVERYVLDDGWFGARRNDRAGLGDWSVSPDVWPDGLHPLVDRVTELGMQFGLWFEPEMVNPDSDVARAHPEWIMQTGDRLPIEGRSQQVINLGIPECYAYVRDAISAILDEYDIGYLKWDHNRDLIDAGTTPDGRPGVHVQTSAFYRLVDELQAAHPGLEIESCSSGGARVDLGVLQRTDRVWVSDCIDPLDRQQMHRWTTQLIPPELMGAHIASGRSHTTGRVHDLSFRAATAVFGHLGVEWDLAEASEAELAELSQWIGFYRQERSFLLSGDLVRVDLPDDSLYAYGVLAPDRSRAIFALVALDQPDVVSVGRIPLPGLDPDRRYRVSPVPVSATPSGLKQPPWWPAPSEPGEVFSGAALASVGLRAPGMHPEQAVLLRVDGIDGID